MPGYSHSTAQQERLAQWEGLRSQHLANYQGLLAERRSDLLALKRTKGPPSVPYSAAKHQYERADFQYLTIHRVLLRPISKYDVRWPFVIAFGLALALLETPINKFLFDIALYGSNIASYAVSFAFAVFLLILAHIAGKSIRQIWSDYRHHYVWHLVVIFVVCIVTILTMVIILMIARDNLDRVITDTGLRDLFGQITATVSQVGLLETIKSAFSNTHALTLFAVNIGAIFMTLMVSYFTHDGDKDYDEAARVLERARSKLQKLDRRYTRRQSKVLARYRTRLTMSGKQYDAANHEVVALKKALREPLGPDERLVIWSLDQPEADIAQDAEEFPHQQHQRATAEELGQASEVVRMTRPS